MTQEAEMDDEPTDFELMETEAAINTQSGPGGQLGPYSPRTTVKLLKDFSDTERSITLTPPLGSPQKRLQLEKKKAEPEAILLSDTPREGNKGKK